MGQNSGLSISKTTVVSRILHISKTIKLTTVCESHQTYEIDELYVKLKGMSRCWLMYAINRNTKQLSNFRVGSNNKINLSKVVNSVLRLSPTKVCTDRLTTYRKLIPKAIHSTKKYQTNTIERFNLTLRTHLKRFSRKTICFSKNITMLIATIKIYFWYTNSNRIKI